jgi:hypothetical protein
MDKGSETAMPKQGRTKKPSPKPSPKIVRALFDSVINPLLHALPQEYELLEQRNWTWRFRADSLELIRMTPQYLNQQTKDNLELFIELYPKAKIWFTELDGGVESLIAACKECHAAVKASNRFREVFERATTPGSLVEMGVADISLLFGAYPKENQLDVLAEQAVNNTWSLPAYYPISRLWNKYGTEFLNVLAEPDVQDSYRAVLGAGQELENTTRSMIVSLRRLRLEMSLEYGEPFASTSAPAEVS